MTERVLGPTGSPRRRRTLLLPLVAVISLALFYVAGAQAVHDETFELDGNIVVDAGGAQNVDWASLFNASGGTITPLPTGFDAASFKKDFNNTGTTFQTNDASTYATGSKDTLPISGWQCNLDNNVNSKIDVANAYAASYTDPTGDEILYFALERNANTGTADVGFWFLQGNVGCTSAGPATTFSGAHQDGDLLVVSEFTGGGTVSTINVYRWDGGANGSLRETPVASGVDCRSASLPADDETCGASNTGSISTPWITAVKTANPNITNTLPTAQFFEGGVNLTDSNLGGKCFNTFIGDTRSSTSLTATLFDFAGGTLGACTSETVTTPNISTPTQIPVSGGLSVTDSATVTVTGATTFSGTVTFFLCGPNTSQTLCTSGGTQVGTSKAVTASGQTVVSDATTVTSAGHYCWRAVFSGDSSAGVPGSSDARASECFQITPRTPTISTSANQTVSLTSAISDSALLSGTANDPDGSPADGTITFTAYGPTATSTAVCTTQAFQTTVAVQGDGTYGPVSFTPTAPGFYHWIASYNGDSPNTNGVSGSCGDAGERDEVLQLQPAISTAQNFVPNDSATITVASGAGDLAGSVVFKLYVNDADCSEAAAFTSSAIDITSGTGTGLSRTVVSNNTTSYNVSGTTFHWVVEYTNTNPGHKNVTSACGIEHSSITIDNDGP